MPCFCVYVEGEAEPPPPPITPLISLMGSFIYGCALLEASQLIRTTRVTVLKTVTRFNSSKTLLGRKVAFVRR